MQYSTFLDIRFLLNVFRETNLMFRNGNPNFAVHVFQRVRKLYTVWPSPLSAIASLHIQCFLPQPFAYVVGSEILNQLLRTYSLSVLLSAPMEWLWERIGIIGFILWANGSFPAILILPNSTGAPSMLGFSFRGTF